MLLTSEHYVLVREKVEYDPDTGIMRNRRLGRVLGRPNHDGYLRTNFHPIGHKFIHQLAFLWMTGSVPTEIDHINRVRNDNRWDNLRAADRALNNSNSDRRRKNLHKGVYQHSGGYAVQSKGKYVGWFKGLDEALHALSLTRESH